MGDKRRGAEDKMLGVDAAISDARRMGDYVLAREFRGPGDTIEAAAHRAEAKYGVPASFIQRLRHRDVSDMLLSNWLRLRQAYEAACRSAERAADHQKFLAEQAGANAANSTAFAFATLLDSEEKGNPEAQHEDRPSSSQRLG